MGANAQTSVPTFTAGEVLTAANMNISARTGVPVFATTITRDAAFGGTGEKTLAEGQMCYVEGTGFQTYNGTSWVTWGAAPATGGLELISSTTIGSAVSSVTVSNVFSSSYDNYRILINGGVASTDVNMNLQLGATTTGYYFSGILRQYTAATVSPDYGANTSTFPIVGRGTTNSLNGVCDLFAPYLAKNTHAIYSNSGANTADYFNTFGGYLANTTSYTAFTLVLNTGNMTGGTIKVYGYKN